MMSQVQNQLQKSASIAPNPLVRSIGLGVVAGLASTLIMDLCMMAIPGMLGLGATYCFSAVGDTVARFFSTLSIQMTGGVPLGVAIPYLVGSIIGAIYGILVTRFPSLRTGSLIKSIGCAVIYVEILSQPMVWMTPYFLKMALNDSLLWFAGALVMHLVWGAVLGMMVYHGLRLEVSHAGIQ